MVLGEVIFSHIIHHLNPIHHHSPALETHYDNGLWENKGILNFHSINIYCWLILWLPKQQVTAGDQLWPSHSLETRYLEREGGDTFPIYGCGIVFASTKHFFHFSSEWTLNWQENCETDISTQPWEHRNYQIRKLCRPCWFLGTHQIKRKSQKLQLFITT